MVHAPRAACPARASTRSGRWPARSSLFGVATLLHGSGFLAVFVAGILIGDERAPYKREIERFHSALASLGEIVAFAVLGLTVDLEVLTRADVLVPGLVLGVVVAFVVRPIAVGLCLWPVGLSRNETSFVLFAGLKGAVPLLLGELILAADVPDAERLFGIVAVVVIFSVLVQGSLTPVVADVLKIPMHPVAPEPWALGVRLRDEPEGVHRFRIRSGAPAEGRRIADLDDDLPERGLDQLRGARQRSGDHHRRYRAARRRRQSSCSGPRTAPTSSARSSRADRATCW